MAEIVGKSKITDVYDSVLYGRVRAQFDKECAGASDECREALEVLADMVGQAVRHDSALCGKVLEGGKSLSGAYNEMRKVVEARVKPKRGVLSCGVMAPDEAERIVLSYFGIEKAPASRNAAASASLAEEKAKRQEGRRVDDRLLRASILFEDLQRIHGALFSLLEEVGKEDKETADKLFSALSHILAERAQMKPIYE